MTETAKLILEGKEFEFPVRIGTEGNRVIDIEGLFERTGHITLDEAFANTGATTSEITYSDGYQGLLRYRGYNIEELADGCDFLEVAHLLIFGRCPDVDELETFRKNIRQQLLPHEGMQTLFAGFPPNAHPMAILSSVVGALPIYCSDALDPSVPAQAEAAVYHILAKMPTIAAYSYKQSIGEPFVYPRSDLTYCQNFLYMMFARPSERYEMNADFVDALNLLMILYADHGQNCSTSTVRMVGSSNVNLFSCISAGTCAMWGEFHGGAGEACMNMLEQIHADGNNVRSFLERAKDPNDSQRLPGFGHRIYKIYDPRAKIVKEVCKRLLRKHGCQDPIFDLAEELEEAVLSDPFFIERRIFPNVDFYAALIYRIMGIPRRMYTVLFALGRLPGWVAHWYELHQTQEMHIHRPRQLYVGSPRRRFVPLRKR